MGFYGSAHMCVCVRARIVWVCIFCVCMMKNVRMSTCCSWALWLCICVDGCVCVYDRTNVRNFSLCMCVTDEECQSVVHGRCACVSGLIGVRAYDRMNVRNFSLCMGWLRLVGSFKLQVSFAEYCLFHRALLQKRPRILRSLLIEATLQLERQTCNMHYIRRHLGWLRLLGSLNL